MSEFSRETLLNIIETDHVQCGEASALARMALAAMDSSESVEMPLDYLQGHKDGLEWAAQLAEANHPETGDWLYDDPIELAKAIRKGPDMPPAQPVADSDPVIIVGDDGGDALSYRRLIQSFEPGTKLYRHAQPAPERDRVRCEHAEWSHATFGNVGPVGPLKHLSKEALEAAEQPGDLSEWADMQFLMWDAQRRAGVTDEQITQAMIDKLAVNKQREWPEPKDGEPRLHIKSQPAPVVPDDVLNRLEHEANHITAWHHMDEHSCKVNRRDLLTLVNACRAAMLQAGTLTNEGTKQAWTGIPDIDNAINMLDRIDTLESCDDDRIEAVKTVLRGLAGNSPVIPDGYVMVPVEPNGDMLAAAQDAYGETDGDIASTLRATMLAAAPPATRQ